MQSEWHKKNEEKEASFGPSNILSSDVTVQERLGKGTFGVVYRGKYRNLQVAIKKPVKQDLKETDQAILRREVDIMSKISHPNICKFLGASLEPKKVFIVTELMEGMLSELLHDPKDTTPLSGRLGWALEAAKGINWMHEHNPPIIHADIKPDNILYDSERRIKVIDFGLSILKEGSNNHLCEPVGTPHFMAPEMLLVGDRNPTNVTEKVDVYSFGILLWEVITKKLAFEQHSDIELFRLCVQRGERPRLPKCLPALRDLVTRCWTANPQERPTMREVVTELRVILVQYKALEKEEQVHQDIHDTKGQTFWVQCFQSASAVSWSKFSRAFCDSLNQSTAFCRVTVLVEPQCLLMQCLRAVVTDSKDLVSRVSFGKVLSWFGPLQLPLSAAGPGCHMLHRIKDTLQLPYFHGYISSQYANRLLSEEQKGSYLVRFSGHHPNHLCLSYVGSDCQVKHVLIQCEGGRFHRERCSSRTVSEIVASSVSSLELKQPLQTEQFAHIFVDNDNGESVDDEPLKGSYEIAV